MRDGRLASDVLHDVDLAAPWPTHRIDVRTEHPEGGPESLSARDTDPGLERDPTPRQPSPRFLSRGRLTTHPPAPWLRKPDPPVSAPPLARSKDPPAGPANSSCQTGPGEGTASDHAMTAKRATKGGLMSAHASSRAGGHGGSLAEPRTGAAGRRM